MNKNYYSNGIMRRMRQFTHDTGEMLNLNGSNENV